MKSAEHERACARVASLFRQRWLRLYVGRKLRTDPVFSAAFELFARSDAPIIDLGCGVGLLAAYLRERNCQHPIIGIDRDGRKISLAREMAAHANYRDVEFREGDLTAIEAEGKANVALVDVLHYLPAAQQRSLLRTVAQCVSLGGIVAIREAPQATTIRFLLTYAGERMSQAISWNVAAPLQFPTAMTICDSFRADDYEAEKRPLWGRTPFNNHLFIFRRRASAVASARE
ncbi:MAG: class I SAM-dependent methyltransferase [Chthoniobacterales bacterium]